MPAARDLRQTLRLLQRPRFHVLTFSGEDREALRQFVHTYGRSLAALHLEECGQFKTAEAAWATGDDLAMTLLEVGTISTDDHPGFLRRFKAAFFAGYQVHQHEVATALRRQRRQERQATLLAEADCLEPAEPGSTSCAAHQPAPGPDEAVTALPLVLAE